MYDLLRVKVKKLHDDAVIPSYAKAGDAGTDLTAVELRINKEEGYIEYLTGLAFEIPEGHVGLIFPRSSISNKPFILSNSVGVIDSGYRGEVGVRLKQLGEIKINERQQSPFYKKGDRVAQMIIIPYPQIEFVETNYLAESERGTGGYGSTNTEDIPF